MSHAKNISINGVVYDAVSGMPLAATEEKPVEQELRRVQQVHAKGMHRKTQRSQTLNRQFVKKAAPAVKAERPANLSRVMDMRSNPTRERSPHISKFAPTVVTHKPAITNHTKTSIDIPAQMHPVAARAHAVTARHTSSVARVTSQEIKKSSIEKALAEAKPAVPHKSRSTTKRATSIASACAALLLLAGYFTYLNMPNLSVRVAAAQAGIDASYPEYRPIGYRMNGPVAYKNGEVSMEFASNSSPQKFALAQSNSSWDSTALLENYVDPQSNGRYATYSDAGLTVYTFGNNAAWVNGGILYTINGTATLSNEQVRRIATSL